MVEKTITHPAQKTVAPVIDERTLHQIDRIAQKYGATREEVVEELLRLALTERPEGSTLH